MKWECKCGLCGYESEFHKMQWIARLLAIWHTIIIHPYGYCYIKSVDTVNNTDDAITSIEKEAFKTLYKNAQAELAPKCKK